MHIHITQFNLFLILRFNISFYVYDHAYITHISRWSRRYRHYNLCILHSYLHFNGMHDKSPHLNSSLKQFLRDLVISSQTFISFESM